MLGKLLKLEFRATSRVMLPMLGVLTVLIVLANASIRLLDGGVSNSFLTFLLLLLLILAVIAVVAAEVMPLVIMIQRFYKNLLHNEGYLMHTLPVSVHELVWAKIIVSLVWMLVTNLVIFLLFMLSAWFQSGTDLAELISSLPSGEFLRARLQQMGINSGDITLFLVELAAALIIGGIVVCLHFYAAMSLGHSFANHKVLMSVLLFLAIQIGFNLISNLLNLSGLSLFRAQANESMAEAFRSMRRMMAAGIGLLGLRGVVLYVLTTLGLRKGLNLA